MMSSILVDRVVFLSTQDKVTLLRASELDTRTCGFVLYRQVLQTICTYSEHGSTQQTTCSNDCAFATTICD